VIAVADLHAAGLDDDAIRRRVAAGRLHRVYPGVYAVGHTGLSVHGRYLAAVLASGEGAVLSHRSAGHLLRLLRGRPPEPEVTAHTKRRHVTVHRIPLDSSERWSAFAIPVTSVARTLLDLAARLSLDDLARACHEAHIHHHTTPAQVGEVIRRAPNRKGAARLRRILLGDEPTTLSALERGFLELLRAAKLPRPQTNRHVHGGYVDCRWPAHRLTVELVSYRFHATRHQFEEDGRRERRVRAGGDEYRRYACGDVFEDPYPMLAELGTLIAA
jgi:hypothetical protein